MSQFRIRGIDYADENLQHGLGIGSGRGRPKGSKNGQIMPGAAYMQKYKIVGEKAEGTTNLPGAQSTTRRLAGPINPNLQRDYRRAVNQRSTTQSRPQQQSAPNNSQLMRGVKMVRSNSNQPGVHVPQPGEAGYRQPTNTGTTPSENVSRGKNAVSQLLQGVRIVKSNSNQPGRLVPQPGATASTEQKPSAEREFVNDLLNNVPDSTNSRRLNLIQPVGSSNATRDTKRPNGNNPAGNTPSASTRDTNQPDGNNPIGNTPSNFTRDTNQPNGNNPDGNQPDENNPNGNQPEGNHPNGNDSTEAVPSEQQPASNTQQEQAQPAEQRQETPEQKSFWDNVGGWFAQAGKDIGDTVVSALNTAGGAISDAAVWVGDRLKEGGEWALASMGDVGEWIGDRASDLNTWWNGRGDVEVLDRGRWRQGHDGGAREAVGNFFNDAGQRIGNAAGDVGRAVGGAANTAGQWIGNAAGDVGRAVGGAANSAGQWIGNAAGDVGRTVGNAANATGQWIGNAAGDVGRAVGGAVNDAGQWIGNAAGDVGRWAGNAAGDVGRAANAAGQWIGNAAGDVGRAVGDAAGHVGAWAGQRAQDVSNFVNGVQPGTPAAAPYLDLGTGQWVYPASTPGLGERIGNAAGDAGQAIDRWWNGDNSSSRSPLAQPLVSNPVSEWVNSNVIDPVFGGILPNSNASTNNGGARGWINDNIVAPVSNAANGVGDFVRNTANDAGQWANNNIVAPVGAAVNNASQAANDWWNGTDRTFLGFRTGHTPGARENIGNAVNQAAQAVGDVANDAWDGVTGAANTVGQAAGNTALAARAIRAGVPVETVSQLTSALAGGQLSPEDYEHRLNLAIGFSR